MSGLLAQCTDVWLRNLEFVAKFRIHSSHKLFSCFRTIYIIDKNNDNFAKII